MKEEIAPQQPQADNSDKYIPTTETDPNKTIAALRQKLTEANKQIAAMTQSDAPNEGREEKTARQFLEENKTSPETLYNLGAADGIQLSLGERIEKAMREFSQQENTSLRDQLSKERETTEQIKKSFGQIIHDLKIDLQKEREMKKDLVNHLSELLSDYKNHCVWLDFEERTEAILAKASELDKN